MSVELFASITGIVISLACSYIPGLAPRWNTLDGVTKRMIMGILMLAVAITAVALSCSGIAGIVTCDKVGVITVLSALVSALVANQGVYQLTRGS